MGIQCTVYIFNIIMMINQKKGKEVMTKYNDKIMNKRLKGDGFQFDKRCATLMSQVAVNSFLTVFDDNTLFNQIELP